METVTKKFVVNSWKLANVGRNFIRNSILIDVLSSSCNALLPPNTFARIVVVAASLCRPAGKKKRTISCNWKDIVPSRRRSRAGNLI